MCILKGTTLINSEHIQNTFLYIYLFFFIGPSPVITPGLPTVPFYIMQIYLCIQVYSSSILVLLISEL